MLNKAILIGRLTKDPESRMVGEAQVCNFTLAVDRNFSREGNKETDFIPVVAWRKTAELCKQYLFKGNLAAVSGRIQVRSYDGNDGTRRYITEIVADDVQFLTPRSESAQQRENSFDNYGIPVDGMTDLEDLDVPF